MKRLLLALAATSLLLAPASYAAKGDRKNTTPTPTAKSTELNSRPSAKTSPPPPISTSKPSTKITTANSATPKSKRSRAMPPRRSERRKTKSKPLLQPSPGGPAPRGAAFFAPAPSCLPPASPSVHPVQTPPTGASQRRSPRRSRVRRTSGFRATERGRLESRPFVRTDYAETQRPPPPAPPFSLPIRGR